MSAIALLEVCERNDTPSRVTYELEKTLVLVGRSQECGIRLDERDLSVSRVHFCLVLCKVIFPCTYVLIDGGVDKLAPSANGVFVNDAKVVVSAVLAHGDSIRVGKSTIARFFLCESITGNGDTTPTLRSSE
jgi:pSer/pThr/pTyr-binding forkhead associated (FHA) protein